MKVKDVSASAYYADGKIYVTCQFVIDGELPVEVCDTQNFKPVFRVDNFYRNKFCKHISNFISGLDFPDDHYDIHKADKFWFGEPKVKQLFLLTLKERNSK